MVYALLVMETLFMGAGLGAPTGTSLWGCALVQAGENGLRQREKITKVKKTAVLVKAVLLTLGNEEQVWIWPLVGRCALGLFAFIPSVVETLWPLELWINELERAGAAATWFYHGFCSPRCRGRWVGDQHCWKSPRSRSPSPQR